MDRRKAEMFVKLGAVGAGSDASPHLRSGIGASVDFRVQS